MGLLNRPLFPAPTHLFYVPFNGICLLSKMFLHLALLQPSSPEFQAYSLASHSAVKKIPTSNPIEDDVFALVFSNLLLSSKTIC
jgi:hypothetical protein